MPEGKDRSHVTGSSVRGAQERLVAGRYLLLRQLGRGGMGSVWLAADELLGRLVAVKELRPPSSLGGVEQRTHRLRALQEARSAARIQHGNAVTLYEVVTVPADDAIYLIMELVEGPTLGELVAESGPLPAPRVARFGLQLLDVLAAAHALGIVHRDVKPDNILIAARDQVKLADFGIAHTLGDPRLTTGGVMGTRAYLAPELFDEDPITPAADLWSLGATLYHAAEGRGAFDRESTGATLRAILVDDIPAPRCDPRLAGAIAALLRRDPGERATIEQASALLRRVAVQRPAPEPTLPDPPPAVPLIPVGNREWDPNADTGRNQPTDAQIPPAPPILPEGPPRLLTGKRWAAVAAAVLVLAAGGTVGGLLAARSPAGSPGASSPFSTTQAAVSSEAVSSRPASSQPARGSSGTATRGQATPPSTGITSGALTLRKTITGPQGVPQRGIAYSPDGTMLATYGADDGRDATVWNVATGTEVTTLPFGTDATDVAFSHDSQSIAVSERYGGVGVWSAASRSVTFNVTDPDFATGVSFNPSGGTLAVGDSSGIRLLSLSTHVWVATLPGTDGAAGPWTVAFSPNGNTLAAADRRTGYVYVWRMSADALIGTIAPAAAGDVPGLGTSISYAPDSGLLAVGSSGKAGTFPGVRFFAVQPQSVTLVSTMQYPGVGGVNALAYDPAASDVFAAGGTNGYVYLWEMPSGTKLAHPLDPGGAEIADVAFSADGKAVAVLDVDDRIFLWKVAGVG
jgi:serine/threonine protein kinase